MFSASAASPGRANSLLQKYFLQTRVPWGEMGARSSRWARESAPIHCSQRRQACWHVWLTLALTHCFVSSETTPERDFQACPCSWSHQFCLRSQKLLLLAEKAHCLLKKSAVVLIQEVSMDISGNTETIISLLNVNERLDKLDDHYFGFKFHTQAAWLSGVKRCRNVFSSLWSKLQIQIASAAASQHTQTRDICRETWCNATFWHGPQPVKQERDPSAEHREREIPRAAAPPHLKSWE